MATNKNKKARIIINETTVELLFDGASFLSGRRGTITEIKKQSDGQLVYKFSSRGSYEWVFRSEITTDLTPLYPGA